MFTTIFEGLKKMAPSNHDPNRILEVNAEDYVCYSIILRDDCLVMYKAVENDVAKFDIVLLVEISQTNSKIFSIFRTNDELSGQSMFYQFREKLPLLIMCVPDISASKFALQNLTQLIREKPLWTAAHIAAHFGYLECFKNPVIQSQINMASEDSLMTPLHVAVKAQQIGSVQCLVELDARMDAFDVNGDTVFHLAATTNKEIIQALTKKPVAAVVLNSLNNKNCTPFHLACMADKSDCVMEFIKAGVDVNISCGIKFPTTDSPSRIMREVLESNSTRFFNSDIKYGGTPLHWSKTPEVTELLLDHGCSINAQNFQGDTALHVMVKRSRFACAMVLLSHQADVDVQNAEGNTPLHLAVKNCDLSLVQAFIVFGSDVNKMNNAGETPRHLAASEKKSAYADILYSLHMVEAKRCVVTMPSCNEGCKLTGQFNGIPPENVAFSKKTESLFEEVLLSMGQQSFPFRVADATQNEADFGSLRVLCLDGGGIRGMVLIQMLAELEKIVGRPILELFDVIAGTSTGGVLALVISSEKSISDSRCLYFRLKDRVFVGTRPYDSDALETFLKTELGESKVMEDIKHPKLMITATRGDRKPADLHLFRNYESPVEIMRHVEKDVLTNEPLPKPKEQLLWQAARATGAAPTYFRASGPFIDGGLISNNPTLDAITEIHQCNQAWKAVGRVENAKKIKVLVSMGTGRPPLIPVNTIDVFRPDTLWGACRMALGVTNLGQLLVDQATQTDGRVTARASAICNMLGVPYIRLNPQLSENVALDETNTKTLIKILWETSAYMCLMRDEIQKLSTFLSN